MGTWGPGIALPACFSQATKKLLTIANNLYILTSFNSASVCVPQVKWFTAILRGRLSQGAEALRALLPTKGRLVNDDTPRALWPSSKNKICTYSVTWC